MTVRDIVYTAARELGLYEEVMRYVEDISDAGENNAEMLINCFNIVENELALDYFPLYTEEQVYNGTGKILYSQLSKTPVRITKVADSEGQEIEYGLYADHIKTKKGAITVAYAYTPTKKGIRDTSDFVLQVSERLIIYGVLSQYCLAMGFCEQAAMWDTKYKESIETTYRMGKGGRMSSRRWV